MGSGESVLDYLDLRFAEVLVESAQDRGPTSPVLDDLVGLGELGFLLLLGFCDPLDGIDPSFLEG